jgi:hypothetical protein
MMNEGGFEELGGELREVSFVQKNTKKIILGARDSQYLRHSPP